MSKRKIAREVKVFTLLAILVLTLAAVYPAMASGSPARPFRMKTHEVLVAEGPGGGCPFVQAEIEGYGKGIHLGQLTLTRTHCFTPWAEPPIHDGQWSVVAANGDQIWGTYEGVLVPVAFDDQGNPTLGVITSPFTIEGGTGRFVGAHGGGMTTGEFNILTGEGDLLSEGGIGY